VLYGSTMPTASIARLHGVAAMHDWALLGLFYAANALPLALFDRPEESAAIVALTTALAVGAKLAWNLIDRKVPKIVEPETHRVCFMGQGAADQLLSYMKDHDHKTEMMLETLTEIAQNQKDISQDISKSLAVLTAVLDRRRP
jgi:hypothetical protein